MRFDNGTARNATVFGVDNSSSFPADNCKNNFLVLGPTFRINRSFGSLGKKLGLISVNQVQNLA